MKYQSLIRDSSIYTLRTIIANFTSVVQIIFIAWLLGPELYGTLNVYRIILGYTTYASLGMLWAMLREIPFYRGNKKHDKIEEVKNTAFSSNIINAVIVSILILVIALSWHKILSISVVEITILALIVIAQQLYEFLDKYLISQKNFSASGRAAILFSLVNFILIFALGFLYKLTGILMAMLIAYCLSIIYVVQSTHFKANLLFNKQGTIRLVKIGSPILGNGFLYQGMDTADRIMTVNLLGRIQLGYYGIAGMAKQFIGEFYTAIFMTIFPRLTEKYGETSNIKDIKDYVLKPMLVAAHLSPLFIGMIIIFITPMFRYILPKYMPGLEATRIVISLAYFSCLQAGIPNFLIAVNKITKIYPFRITAIILNIFIIYVAIKLGSGITGVAVSSLFAYIIYTTALINYLLGLYSIQIKARIKFILYIYYPFLFMLASLWIVNFFSFGKQNVLFNDIMTLILRIFIFFILNMPLLIHINNKTSLFDEMKNFGLDILQKKMRRVAVADSFEV